MASKKDFSQVNTGRVYDQIDQATAETEPTEEGKRKRGRPKKTNTQDRRINMTFDEDVFQYAEIMAIVTGVSRGKFINAVLRKHMKDNMELYKTAQNFRKSISGGLKEE